MKTLILTALLASGSAFAQPQPPQPRVIDLPPPPPRPGGPGGPGGGVMPPGVGIPPPVAQKLGISAELQKKVRDLGFEANKELISLEADLKRAQLELEMYLSGAAVEEAPALTRLEAVTRAETAVKKNRLGLMIRVRKALGPELWSKLEAEMPPPGMHHGPGGPG